MSFEDYYEVDIDADEGVFTIIRNNGTANTYSIDKEADLLFTILEHENEVDIYQY